MGVVQEVSWHVSDDDTVFGSHRDGRAIDWVLHVANYVEPLIGVKLSDSLMRHSAEVAKSMGPKPGAVAELGLKNG